MTETDTSVQHIFGRRLRKVRLERNLSQEDLAKRLNVRQDTISDYECGRGRPTLDMIWQMACVLGVDVGYFFPQERFAVLAPEDRETLALLESLSPMRLKYILAFIQVFFVHQQREQWWLENLLETHDHRTLLNMIERDLNHFEALLKQDAAPCPLEILGQFTALMMMTRNASLTPREMHSLIERIASCTHRMIRVVGQGRVSA